MICARCRKTGIKTIRTFLRHKATCVDPRWAKVAKLHRLGHHDRAARVARRLLGIKGPPMPPEVKEMLRARRKQKA